MFSPATIDLTKSTCKTVSVWSAWELLALSLRPKPFVLPNYPPQKQNKNRCEECESSLHQFVEPKPARPHYSLKREEAWKKLLKARPAFCPAGRNVSTTPTKTTTTTRAKENVKKPQKNSRITKLLVGTTRTGMAPRGLGSSASKSGGVEGEGEMAERVQELEVSK